MLLSNHYDMHVAYTVLYFEHFPGGLVYISLKRKESVGCTWLRWNFVHGFYVAFQFSHPYFIDFWTSNGHLPLPTDVNHWQSINVYIEHNCFYP